jgi:hypothetical protein
MLVTLGVLGVALAGVGAAAAWLLRSRDLSRGQSVATIAVATWLTAMAVVAWRHDEPRARSELVQSLDSLAWPSEPRAVAPPMPPPASARSSATGVQAPSVESLVGGLEARLAATPDDAEGWALLAQSYAYTANEEAVERAVRRAVELGFDEAALRERVDTAKRSARPVDWVERAIGARRP